MTTRNPLFQAGFCKALDELALEEKEDDQQRGDGKAGGGADVAPLHARLIGLREHRGPSVSERLSTSLLMKR